MAHCRSFQITVNMLAVNGNQGYAASNAVSDISEWTSVNRQSWPWSPEVSALHFLSWCRQAKATLVAVKIAVGAHGFIGWSVHQMQVWCLMFYRTRRDMTQVSSLFPFHCSITPEPTFPKCWRRFCTTYAWSRKILLSCGAVFFFSFFCFKRLKFPTGIKMLQKC